MRVVVQRVKEARVEVGERTVGRIGKGLLALVGVGRRDELEDAQAIAKKIAELRIFEDEQGKMNRSVEDEAGAVLVVSQFTLFGDVRKGRRPSFGEAMEPVAAAALVNAVALALKGRGLEVATGEFGAMMDVHLVNAGPVTILLDSKKLF